MTGEGPISKARGQWKPMEAERVRAHGGGSPRSLRSSSPAAGVSLRIRARPAPPLLTHGAGPDRLGAAPAPRRSPRAGQGPAGDVRRGCWGQRLRLRGLLPSLLTAVPSSRCPSCSRPPSQGAADPCVNPTCSLERETRAGGPCGAAARLSLNPGKAWGLGSKPCP